MTQFNKLIEYVEKLLSKTGLKLSQFGKDELLKRFNKKESNGGFSDYWRNL